MENINRTPQADDTRITMRQATQPSGFTLARICCAVCLLAMVIILFFQTVPVFAASGNVYIYDGAGLLTDSEEQELQNQLSGYSKDRHYLIVTENDYMSGASSMHGEMDECYHEKFGDSDGVAFIINMSDRQLYTGGFGSCRQEFTSGDARDVTDNVYRYATNGNYYECLSEAFSQINDVVENGFILRPMRYAVAILLGIFLGFFIMFIVMVSSRKNRKVAPVIPENIGRTQFRAATFNGMINPVFLNVVMHRTRRQSSSSSGGSSGGGSSGGGFSGGGSSSSGGGHGF
ncbi:MAG: TPM domain-containing protein [Lachnospiraceae bacterium]|nr:TPM domain-containing protein [Lachnospiraceae bacterium]MDD7327491.1 TPM domain-containing protein [Lachnospiraceae bacterium]MDY2760323.1 TPM domain-containing protein [Lachnospiraceae bacterium]